MPPLQIIIPNLNVGGTEQHLVQMLPLLAARGFKIKVRTLLGDNPLASKLQKVGIDVVSPPRWLHGLPKVILYIYSALTLLWDHLRDRKTVRHYFLPAAYLLGATCGVVTRQPAPQIMSRRSLNSYQHKYPLIRAWERWLHPHMRWILGNSEAIIQELRAEEVPTSRLKCIYNGVDPSFFPRTPQERQEIRYRLGIESQTLMLITVANLIPYKGHADMLHALKILKESCDLPWVWVVVGRDGGAQLELHKLTESLHLTHQVHFLGTRTDVPALLDAADISILPSHEEGLPNAVLESMAAALPVVATNVGGIPELVIPQKTGLLVPSHNPPALFEALALLMADPEMRERYGVAGQNRVTQNFSVTHGVDQYEELYRSCVA